MAVLISTNTEFLNAVELNEFLFNLKKQKSSVTPLSHGAGPFFNREKRTTRSTTQ
jgi:hypothetical protein